MKSVEPLASAAARSGKGGAGRQRKRRRVGAERADLADEAIDDAARRPSGEKIGDGRAVVARRLERRTVQCHRLGFRRQQERRADLGARSTQRERRRDAPAITDAAGSDHRHFHRVDHLGYQGHGAGLACHVVSQEHAAMAACFRALRDHRVAAMRLEPACFFGRRGRADDNDLLGFQALHQRGIGHAEMEARDLGLEFEHHVAERRIERSAYRPARSGVGRQTKLAIVRLQPLAPAGFACRIGNRRLVDEEVDVDRPPGSLLHDLQFGPQRLGGQHGGGDRTQAARLRDRDRHLR